MCSELRDVVRVARKLELDYSEIHTIERCTLVDETFMYPKGLRPGLVCLSRWRFAVENNVLFQKYIGCCLLCKTGASIQESNRNISFVVFVALPAMITYSSVQCSNNVVHSLIGEAIYLAINTGDA